MKLKVLLIEESLDKDFEKLLQEGVWDDVKDGAKKLQTYVKGKVGNVIASFKQNIEKNIDQLPKAKQEAIPFIKLLQQGMQETGEKIDLGPTLKKAKGLEAEVGNATAAVETDLEGPVKQFAQTFAKSNPAPQAPAQQVASAPRQESVFLGPVYSILSESEYRMRLQQRKYLKESLTITGVLGIGLAVMGGLPLLFKGLTKIAKFLKMEKTAHIMEHCEHVCHAFEQKVIDMVMPDKLAYAIYKAAFNSKIKISDQLLEFEQFKKDPAMATTKNLIYKALLIYFAVNGLVSAVKAGVSILGFVEGTATTIKGIELAKGAQEIASLASNV